VNIESKNRVSEVQRSVRFGALCNVLIEVTTAHRRDRVRSVKAPLRGAF